MKTVALFLRTLVLMSAIGMAHADQLVVIAHKDVPIENITPEQVTKIFLKQQLHWSNGKPVQPVDLRDGTRLRTEFYEKVTGRSQTQLRTYWARQTFTGMALSPPQMGSAEDVMRYVAATPGAIGYVLSKNIEGNVKVLLTTAQ